MHSSKIDILIKQLPVADSPLRPIPPPSPQTSGLFVEEQIQINNKIVVGRVTRFHSLSQLNRRPTSVLRVQPNVDEMDVGDVGPTHRND